MAEVNFAKIEVQFFEEKLSSSFSKSSPVHLHTTPHRHTPTVALTIKFVRLDRARKADSTKLTPA